MKKKKWIITSVILVVFCTGLVVYNHYRGSSSAADADPSEISIPRKSSVLNVNGLVVRPQPSRTESPRWAACSPTRR